MTASPQPDTIKGLIGGGVLSFAMLAGMQLGVFDPLGKGPLTDRRCRRPNGAICRRGGLVFPGGGSGGPEIAFRSESVERQRKWDTIRAEINGDHGRVE